MPQARHFLASIGACVEAVDWAGDRSLQECWDVCDRPNWLIWLLDRMEDEPKWPTKKQLVSVFCAVAETATPFTIKTISLTIADIKSASIIEAAKAWLRDEATELQVNLLSYLIFLAFGALNKGKDVEICNLIRTMISLPLLTEAKTS